ncbi:transposable element Tcb1 transposase [Trichonephila clavipes]|nr:transposable element Tcb1 transposase [Trichonephila clavipes]
MVSTGKYKCVIPKETIDGDLLLGSGIDYLVKLGDAIKKNDWKYSYSVDIESLLVDKTAVLIPTTGIKLRFGSPPYIRVKLSDDYSGVWHSGIAVNKGFCYRKRLNDVLNGIINGGLYEKWINEVSFAETILDGTGEVVLEVRRLSAKRNRRTTAQQVANRFLAASGKQISRNTVARRLTGGGLYARRPVVCVPLTRQHRTARLQWCREHHNWTEQDWACVLFSDESRFSLSSDCRRQLIWHESGTAYRPENIQEKDRYPTCSIMVWAGIMINGRTRLHVVANGTMTGQRYIDEVLLPHVRLFRGAVGDKFVFVDDNATCHRTLAVQDCQDSEGIQRLV